MIRSAEPRDAERIAEIHVRAWQAAYGAVFPADYLRALSVTERRDQWRARLEAGPPPTVLVAEDETGISGWVSVGASRDGDSEGSVGEVYALYVDPLRWGRGAGKSLWSAAVALGASRGWDRMTVWVLEENARARRFYESVGLTLEPAQRRMYQRDGLAAPSVRYATASSGA